jgi:hypothetical protein
MKTMNYILNVLDYVYYRTFHWYKEKKESMPGIMATSVVAILITFFLFDVIICLSIFLSFPIPDIPKWIIAVLYLCGLGLIMYRYSKVAINKLDLRWKSEDPKKKKRRGWIIFFVILGELLFIVISSYIRHNVLGNAKFFR